jgi:hypothetical protein
VLRRSMAADCPDNPDEAREPRHLDDITVASEIRHNRPFPSPIVSGDNR